MLPFRGLEDESVVGYRGDLESATVPSDDLSVLLLMKLTDEQQFALQHTPQDLPTGEKNPVWLDARRPSGISRITGSVIGSMVGHNKYCSPKKALKELLSLEPFVGNVACRWGQDNEDIALEQFKKFLDSYCETWCGPGSTYEINNYGMFFNNKYPEFGYSPDGEVIFTDVSGFRTRYTIEIKCPYKHRNTPYQETPLYPTVKIDGKNLAIPHYYYDQMMLGITIMETEGCFFVVWTPSQLQTYFVTKNDNYSEAMMSKASDFFWKMYIPALREGPI